MSQKSVGYQIKVNCSKAVTGVKIVSLDESATIPIGRCTNPADANLTTAITFDSKVISRKHALFAIINQKLCIKDTASSSGTFINNFKLSEQGEESEYIELLEGDSITLGEDCDVDGVMHECVQMTLSFSKFEAKASAATDASSPQTYIDRAAFLRKFGLPILIPESEPISPTNARKSTNSIPSSIAQTSIMSATQNMAKWSQMKLKYESGNKSKSEGADANDDHYSIDPRTGKLMLTQESEEITPEQVEEMNNDFDSIWALINNGLEGKLTRYLNLSAPYVEIVKDAGVVGDTPPVTPRKHFTPKKGGLSKIKKNLGFGSQSSLKSVHSALSSISYQGRG